MSQSLVNPAAKVEIVRQGREAQPVIVVDDILSQPDLWRQIAARAVFAPIRPFHPGVSAVVPMRIASPLRAELAPLIGGTFGLEPVPPASSAASKAGRRSASTVSKPVARWRKKAVPPFSAPDR